LSYARVINAALDTDPVVAAVEWLAKFRCNTGGWAAVELIEAAVDFGMAARPPVKGVKYISFCDPSIGARDSLTAAVEPPLCRTA
jgi:hypothetical protein